MKKYTLTEYCTLNNRPELLEEWDYEKNGELTPDNAYPNNKKKVFWICKEGHQWAVAISCRVVDKTGCPFCAGKRVKSGNNDLETLYPDLAKEWHPTKNGMLKPSDVRPGTHGKVWWQCKKGHEWQARVQSRTSGNGCPYCVGRLAVPGETDLETLYPDLAKEWHPTKNGMLKPSGVHPGTHGKVWWQCEKGHEWQAEVQSRTRGNGCPYCAGLLVVPGETDLETLYPEIALQWHPTKNGLAKPSEANPGSNKRFWWKCEKGHEWLTTIASRVDGTGCPYCTGRKVIPGENDFASSHPGLAKEWHPTKNGNLKPDMVPGQSNQYAWWQCEKGHEWRALISSRASGNNCPYCSDCKLLTGFNDLQTKFPHIAAEWDSEKNGITPDKVKSSHKKAWWRCPKGHEYYSEISARVHQNAGCPVCANRTVVEGVNDLATLYPELAKEWHPTKNGDLKPTMVSGSSLKKAWWQDKFGHEWFSTIQHRSYNGTGCPYCAGRKVWVGFNDLATKEPKIAAQWHPVLNGDKTLYMFTCGSNYKAWWQCSEGHVWRAPIGRRFYRMSGCPFCDGRKGEKTLLKYEILMREEMKKLNADPVKDSC